MCNFIHFNIYVPNGSGEKGPFEMNLEICLGQNASSIQFYVFSS